MLRKNTINSSPPVRPIISLARNSPQICFPSVFSTSSPNACPMVSLIFLKLSISTTNITAISSGWAARCSLIFRSVAILLFNVVSRSVSALSSNAFFFSFSWFFSTTSIIVRTTMKTNRTAIICRAMEYSGLQPVCTCSFT